MPLSFAPGEAYQCDWIHDVVLIDGATVTVKVAHLRLCHSRVLFARACPRETQGRPIRRRVRRPRQGVRVLRGSLHARHIYDNMKTAVDTIFVGPVRAYIRWLRQMCSHDLVNPVACTASSGWGKGQVENQVVPVRERLFTPRVRVKSFDELNAWLLDQCVAYARARPHPEIRDQTIWAMFEAERSSLVP